MLGNFVQVVSMSAHPISIVLYVRSFTASLRPMIDRETATYSCTCTRSYWDSLKTEIAGTAGRFLSTEDQRALIILDDVVKTHNVNAEIVDLGASFLKRLKLRLKGISRTPLFVVNGKEILGVSNSNQLMSSV